METKQKMAWGAFVDELKKRIEQGPRGTVTLLAERLGTTRGTVSRWASGALRGERVPYDKTAGMMRSLGLDPSPYFSGESVPEGDEYSRVPWLEAMASMGGGSVVTSKAMTAHLAFRTDWLRSKGSLKGMVVINASGDSMSPTIPDRSVVLINESDKRPVNNGIFFVCYREELFLKRLRVDRSGRVTHLISDLDDWENPVDPDEYFEIIGRAIWYGKEL